MVSASAAKSFRSRRDEMSVTSRAIVSATPGVWPAVTEKGSNINNNNNNNASDHCGVMITTFGVATAD